jgi:hypothetical protein
MIKSILSIFLVGFIPFLNHTQTLNELKKECGIQDQTEVILELSEQYKSHFAVGVNFPFVCQAFFLLRETDKERIHCIAKCADKLIHDEFSAVQSASTIAFQPENNSTWVLKNSQEWVILNLNQLRTKGWSPIRIAFESADSIFLLETGHFLTLKGNRKWHNEFDDAGNVVTTEVFFEGRTFFTYYGGLLAPIRENDKLVYKYVQYQQFLFWDDEAQDNLADPHFNYLKPDGQFSADEVVIPPNDQRDCNAIIRQGNQLKVYSFCTDRIVEESISTYYEVPNYGILVLTKDYVAFGRDWKRINCKNPKSAEFENLGDIVICKLTLEDGSDLSIEFPSGEILK